MGNVARIDEAREPYPHDLDAERAALGALLVEDGRFETVRAVVVDEAAFYRQGHRAIFRAFGELIAAGVPLDFLTVVAHLRERGQLDEAGGPAYIASLIDGVPRGMNAEAYAAIVAKHHRARKALAAIEVAKRDVLAGSAVDLETLSAHVAATGTGDRPPVFSFDTPAEVLAEPTKQYLLAGQRIENGLHYVFGRRGAGKTIYAVLGAVAVASNRALGGLRPELSGTVIYHDLEGVLTPRLGACCHHYGIDVETLPIFRPRGAIIDLADRQSVRDYVASIKAAELRPVEHIIDTVSRGATYDENKDGSLIVRACDYIREHVGGAITLIGHPGEHNPDRPRGGNQIEGAADLVLKLDENPATGVLTLIATKNRFGEQGATLGSWRRVAVPDVPHGVTMRPAAEVIDEPLAMSDRDRRALESLRGIGGRARHGAWRSAAVEAGLTTGQFNTALSRLRALGATTQNREGEYESV